MTQHDNDEQAFVANARALLDEQAEQQISSAERAQLRLARQRALDKITAQSSPARQQWFWLAPAMGGACAAAIALAVILIPTAPTPGTPAAHEQWPDMELLAADDELQLYDDLEFLEWLDDSNSA